MFLNFLEEKQEIFDFITNCQDQECGGISASIGHDPHILYTLSAIQILTLYDAVKDNIINVEKVVSFIKSLQQEDGSFFGDKWGEVDIRFTFCSVAALALLGRLDVIDLDKAVDFAMSCYNFCDGGFGSRPGSESHSGLIYCALGTLSIAGQMERIDADLLGWWLAERQLPSGGLNGRPEKMPDLCYSWWVLTSLKILGRLRWINKERLVRFIFACQDEETGGFADRPDNLVDPFHTLFGLTGLSLMSHDEDDYDINENEDESFKAYKEQLENLREKLDVINPVFCLPQSIIDRLNIKVQLLSL